MPLVMQKSKDNEYMCSDMHHINRQGVVGVFIIFRFSDDLRQRFEIFRDCDQIVIKIKIFQQLKLKYEDTTYHYVCLT